MYWHVPQMTLYTTTTTTILHAIVMEKVIVDVMMMVVVRWAPRACAPLCLCVFMCVQTHTTYKSGSQKIEEGPHIREAIEGCP